MNLITSEMNENSVNNFFSLTSLSLSNRKKRISKEFCNTKFLLAIHFCVVVFVDLNQK